jgi:hypothetical protein
MASSMSSSPPTPGISGNRRFVIIMMIVISALIIDTAIIKTAIFFSTDQLSPWRSAVFAIASGTYVAGQYAILKYLRSKSEKGGSSINQNLHLGMLYQIVRTVQYFLIAILLIAVLQIATNHSYSTILLTAAVAISYGLAAAVLAVLSQRFIAWFRSSHNSVVMFYGLASILFAINIIITLVFSVIILQEKPEIVMPHLGVQIPITGIGSGSTKDILNQSYIVSSVAAFAMLWLATVMLLRHHYRKINLLKFWTIVVLPLVYFLSQFLTLMIGVADPIVKIDPVLVSTILVIAFWLSKPAGGLLFGLVFWRISWNVRSYAVRDYMMISAYGLVLLFISQQAIAIVASPSYPPFGLVTISFVGMSSYLFLLGIYSSAISVSHDLSLRDSIRKFTLGEFRLLDGIGSAEWRTKLEGDVRKLIEKNQDTMLQETGIQSSLSDDDVKDYLDDVLQELGKKSKNS